LINIDIDKKACLDFDKTKSKQAKIPIMII